MVLTLLGQNLRSIELVEDREYFKALVTKLNIRQTRNSTVTTVEEAVEKAAKIGYPSARPAILSYWEGRAMVIVYNEDYLRQYMAEAVSASAERPILIDAFLDDAYGSRRRLHFRR